MGQINELQMQIHKTAKEKGFYDKIQSFGTKIALIHSELSEALEADRKRGCSGYSTICVSDILDIEDDKLFKLKFEQLHKDTVDDELSDACIRIFDLAEEHKIDLENHILAKMRFNNLREYKHGKEY